MNYANEANVYIFAYFYYFTTPLLGHCYIILLTQKSLLYMSFSYCGVM